MRYPAVSLAWLGRRIHIMLVRAEEALYCSPRCEIGLVQDGVVQTCDELGGGYGAATVAGNDDLRHRARERRG